MYFDDNITDYQVFIDIELSMFNLLRYLTDFNDIPLMMADRVLGHYASLLAGIEIGYLEGTSFKSLLIECETVRIPAKEFYLLSVFAEKDEYRSA